MIFLKLVSLPTCEVLVGFQHEILIKNLILMY